MSETTETTVETSESTPAEGKPARKRHNNATKFVQRFCYEHRALPTIDQVVEGAKVTRPGAAQAIKVQAQVLGLETPKHPRGRKAMLEGVDLLAQLTSLGETFAGVTTKRLTAALAALHGCSSSLITARVAEQRKLAQ